MTEEGETSEIYFFGLDVFLKCCEAKKRKTRCYITLLVLLCLSSVCAAKKKGKRAAILILQQRSLTLPLFLRGEEILQNCQPRLHFVLDHWHIKQGRRWRGRGSSQLPRSVLFFKSLHLEGACQREAGGAGEREDPKRHSILRGRYYTHTHTHTHMHT